ncbi:molybdenum cofactor guanylyltransferase [Limosilactobacillus fermentum]
MIGLVLAGGQSCRFGSARRPTWSARSPRQRLVSAAQTTFARAPSSGGQPRQPEGKTSKPWWVTGPPRSDPEPFGQYVRDPGRLPVTRGQSCDYPNLTTQSMRVLAGQRMRYLQASRHMDLGHFQTDQETVQAWSSGGQLCRNTLKGVLQCLNH